MRKSLLLIAFLFLWCRASFALDWIALHESADTLTSSEATRLNAKNPDSIEQLYVLGLAYLNEFNNKGAEAVFDTMLARDPALKEARWGKAESLRRRRNYETSQAMLEGLLVEYPEYAPAYISLAYINYIQMEFDEAVDLAYKVIKLGKNNVDLTNFVRAHCLVAGAKGMIAHYGGPISKIINGRSVLPYLKKAEKLQPNAPAVLFGLGSYYLLIPKIFGRDIERAEEYLMRAVEADPHFPDIYVRLAQIAQIRDNNSKYQEYLGRALSLDPDNELVRDIARGKCDFVCITTEK
ncbi:tetratricopeptide repeat protein [Candidatus Omnitrophota bacterium]